MIDTRRSKLRFILFVTFTLLFASPATSAFAQPAKSSENRIEAARMKKEADVLMDQDKYAEALALYIKAYELSGDLALIYNQGRALEAMGEYPEALDKLEQFEREAPPALQKKASGLREHLNDLRGRIATLVITSNVSGARIFVRERAAGSVDKETKIRTRAGPATVEITAEGHETYRTSVELPAGSTVPINAQLVSKKKAAEEALIIVKTKPQADIALDGRALGRSPLETKVTPGSYVLTANAEGYIEERVPMTLAVGDKRQVDLELRQPAPITSRWWFWTGIVVIAAGGVATYLVLTTERSHDEGTLRPGAVPGP